MIDDFNLCISQKEYSTLTEEIDLNIIIVLIGNAPDFTGPQMNLVAPK